jgi:photosystem II stability/assembly factor-like uncharacterized protein
VYASHDGGVRFEPASEGLAVRHVRALAMAPDGRLIAGTEPAALFSRAPGEPWCEATEVAALRERHAWWLPYSPEAGCVRDLTFQASRAYAAVEVGGVLRSDDGGRSWGLAPGSDGRPAFERPPAGRVYPDVHSVAVHPSSSERVYAATADGLYASDDGGARWERRGEGCYARGLWLDPEDPDRLLLGAADDVRRKQGRIERSRDGGRTRSRDAGAEGPWPTAMVERFAVLPGGLAAIRNDGQLLELPAGAERWIPVPLDGRRVRDACGLA